MGRTLADSADRIIRLFDIIHEKETQTQGGLASLSAATEAAASTLTTGIQSVVEQAEAELDKYFPAGTKMLFRGAAPSGWKKLTDHTDYALRLTSGDTGSDAGRFSFSVRFTTGSGTTNDQISWGVNNSTLSVGQLASHSHGQYRSLVSYSEREGQWHKEGDWRGDNVGWRGSNEAHGHGTWNTAHGHQIWMNVNFVDFILCEKG